MRRTILVVEDYEDSRFFMKFLLESYGYEVIEAGNGSEAVEIMRDHFADLILMDISMPVMDGLTATKAIRRFNQASEIPIIAVTAYGRRFYNQAIEAGCNDLIEKPFDFDSLETVIKQYLH
jgi:CheY-like chemotaxis protein